jgi:hypothetical protein
MMRLLNTAGYTIEMVLMVRSKDAIPAALPPACRLLGPHTGPAETAKNSPYVGPLCTERPLGAFALNIFPWQ